MNIQTKKKIKKLPKKKGGARPNSGPKPKAENVEIKALKEEIKRFGAELIEATDPKTGKIIKLKRVLMTIDKMFKLFINHDNVSAGKIFLDYTIGAPDQSIDAKVDGQFTFQFGVKKSEFIKPKDEK
jgi:hypothetical protein